MSDPTQEEPKKISKEEADRLNNYAQELKDTVTHVVDYGEGLNDEVVNITKRKNERLSSRT